MRKSFCDGCGAEITAKNVPEYSHAMRIDAVKPDLSIILRFGWRSPKDNDFEGDWCKHCVLDAVKSLDDRPKPVTMPLPNYLKVLPRRATPDMLAHAVATFNAFPKDLYHPLEEMLSAAYLNMAAVYGEEGAGAFAKAELGPGLKTKRAAGESEGGV